MNLQELKNRLLPGEEITYAFFKNGFTQDIIIAEGKRRFKNKNLRILKEGFVQYDVPRAQEHYAEHFRGSYENAKGFYKELEDYIVSGKVYAMVIAGENAISKVRETNGGTMKIDKETGKEILPAKKTLRYDIPVLLGQKHDMTKNVIHSSDSPEAADREISIYLQLDKEQNKNKDDRSL